MSVESQLDVARLPAEGRVVHMSTPSVDSSLGMKMLPSVLSMIAGSADVIGFLGLGGLFIAHITGNLMLVAGLEVVGLASLRPLLLLQLLLLTGFLTFGVAAGPNISKIMTIIAGML